MIGFLADGKKISEIFKHSKQIEQSAKTVENTLKTTIKSTSNYIKTKSIQLAEKTLGFVEEEVTHLSTVTENVIKNFLKILHLPVPKTVYDDFSKGLNQLFKLDVEKLSEHSILNKASYEIFCSKLDQPKSNIMGFLYAWYGFSKETAEGLYSHYSGIAFDNMILSIKNTIMEVLKNKYTYYVNGYRGNSVSVEDYEQYYVADYQYVDVVL